LFSIKIDQIFAKKYFDIFSLERTSYRRV